MNYFVFDCHGMHMASFYYLSDAAEYCGGLGFGATIRFTKAKKSVIWREGYEKQSAAGPYNYVMHTCYKRQHPEDLEYARKHP